LILLPTSVLMHSPEDTIIVIRRHVSTTHY